MTNNLVDYFEGHHAITIPSWWPQGRSLLLALLSAREAAKDALGSVPSSVLSTEPTFGLLLHLSDRVYEYVAASIVCFATANGATAEVAARVAIESSVNIRFILGGDRNSLALAWLRHYVIEDAKQINQWEKLLPSMSIEERKEHEPSINTRRRLNQIRSNFLTQSEKEFGALAAIDLTAEWPRSIAQRFAPIGEAAAYRTAYARLSSQTHADAEDTISYIMATCLGDNSLLERMAEETRAFSEFLLAYGAYFYLLALKKLCETYRTSIPAELDSGTQQMLSHMREISTTWQW
ncbi:MAG: DUF5677 domain-containing protein [Acidobacteriota bacterium]|nr:DUF5677 domain-containing protein [Acidobacteriota bacterium]